MREKIDWKNILIIIFIVMLFIYDVRACHRIEYEKSTREQREYYRDSTEELCAGDSLEIDEIDSIKIWDTY